jgi:crotonobetaine/carnitine-CoA ligase
MGDDDLKLFIRPTGGHSPLPLDLIKWCESRMPYFQIPRYIESIDEFPKTPTQRIKKSDLPRGVENAFDLEKSGYRIGK